MNRIKFWTKCILLSLSICLLSTNVVHAKVTTFSNLYMDLDVDDSILCIEVGTSNGDPIWEQAGVLDPAAKKKEISKLSATAYIYDTATHASAILTGKTTKESTDLFNLKEVTEEAKQQFYSNLIAPATGDMTATVEDYDGGEVPFFKLHISVSGANKQEEVVYGTIYNGAAIYFDSTDMSIDKINEEFLQKLVAGTHFTKTFTKEEYDAMVQKQFRRILAFFFGAILIFILLVFRNRKKKAKQAELKQKRADALHAYYEKQKQNNTIGAPKKVIFENHTTYTEAMVRQFGIYNNYIKRLPTLCLTIVLYLALLIILFVSGGFTIMFTIVLAAMIGMFYWQYYRVEKLGDQVWKGYKNAKTQVADLLFYDDHFTLSGVEYMSEFPYEQIVEISTYKNYIYLYMSEDRAIYLEKDKFSIEYDKAMEFIHSKLKK